jgi:hypothetical protein
MHKGETPPFDRARVAADATYSLATATQILADKWRAAACVGDNQPDIVEDWYLATWAYNGLSYVNNPNNPNYDAQRQGCDPNVGCGARPYQEKVWGWMEHPPTPEHWAPLAVAYPDPAALPTASGALPTKIADPACASPTDCTARRQTHRSDCTSTAVDGGVDMGGGRGCACDLADRHHTPRPWLLAAAFLVVRLRRRARC